MDSGFDLVTDTIVKDKAYPALARWPARPYTPEWRQFVQHWPNTVPLELYEHCQTHRFPVRLHLPNDYPPGSCYAIGIGFFNFGTDYIDLLPPTIKKDLKDCRLKLLFYYHEGDNPQHIKNRLDQLCDTHGYPQDCYLFVSGNTRANDIDNFFYFPDHELLYWHRNQTVAATTIHNKKRNYTFTVLNRTHKWWRATAMADLWQSGLLDLALWSYRTDVDCGDDPRDNPIEIDTLNLRNTVGEFLTGCPYTCDELTADQHNDHHITETRHFTDSYVSVILETHFDADGSGGAFLTEKTFKAIKHGHPFVIVGCAGSLQTLRELGYRTFDHAIDNSYDSIQDNTQRWLAIKRTIEQLAQQDLHSWFESCREDIEHNQQLFCSSKYPRLNSLFTQMRTA